VPYRTFDELFVQTNGKIEAFVRRRISWDVEDVVDEIYTTAWRKKEAIPDDEKEALLWLFATARRVIANKIRFKSRQDRFNTLNNPLIESTASQHNVQQTWVHEALASMKKDHREALLLVEWDGFSVSEAAKVLDIPETTLTKRLHSARESFSRFYSVIEEREK
jgi:RNA polymerase sigma-70 factor (ECF subfamily)